MNVLRKCCYRSLKENRKRTLVTIVGVILISVSTDSIRDNLEYLEHNANMMLAAMSVLLLTVSVFCSYLLARPLRRIQL